MSEYKGKGYKNYATAAKNRKRDDVVVQNPIDGKYYFVKTTVQNW